MAFRQLANRQRRLATTLVVAASVTLGVASARAATYHVKRLADGFHLPVYATTAPGDDDRIFVVQLGGIASDETDGDPNTSVLGKIMIYNRSTGTVNSQPFLVVNDTSAVDPVVQEPEVGLWALAFHPDYQSNGRFFINVAVDNAVPNSPFSATVREHSVSANPNIANQTPTKTILELPKPAFNHNGSWMGFNPIANAANDNKQYLYITMGDGGDQHDPRQYGQGRGELFGSTLRIDVNAPADPGLNYHVPASNPFVGEAGVRGEIWNYGLRNPWQASFDRETGDFWISDVGQNSWEEINFQPAASEGGENFGWRLREGPGPTPTGGVGGPLPGAIDPVYAYRHFGQGTPGFEGLSVAGGRLYRGPVEELQGKYIFADSRSGEVWDFDPSDPYGTVRRLKLQSEFTPDEGVIDYVVSFGEDNQGNLLIVDYDGELFQVFPNLGVKATIQRETGEIEFANATGEPIAIRGYSITSAAGAIDRAKLTPITGRLDDSIAGNGTIDPDNAWQVTSAPGSFAHFSEASSGTAATLSIDEGFLLSPADGWVRSIYEDLDMEVTLADGSIVPAVLEFVGNADSPFERSDLNFNGSLDPGDWVQFRNHHLQNMAGLTRAKSYQLGDLDGDGDNDFTDFRLFQSDYVSALGFAAFARLFQVPEPNTGALLLTAGVAMLCGRRSRRRRGAAVIFIATMAIVGINTPPASAELRHRYTFNNGTGQDSAGSANGTIGGGASVNLGVLNLPGGTLDFVSLPGPTIDITSYVDATFEAWFSYRGGAAWQRLFDFGRTTMAGSGRDYIFYSPNSSFGDNRAAITSDGGPQENVAFGGPPLATNTNYHVVVVVDDNANGGTNTLSIYLNGTLAGSTPLTRSLSDVSNSLAYIGNSTYTPDPSFNGEIDEFRIYNHAFQPADVIASRDEGPTPLDLLGLEVNTVTGQVTLKNRYSTPLAFDYYRIESTAGAIRPADWNSLNDQHIDAMGAGEGLSWDEFGSPTNQLVAESFLLGASTLAPGGTLDLGHAFDTSTFGAGEDGDLKFRFALQGGDLRPSVINYVTPAPLDGDYNNDGTVNAADYTVWRNALGTALAAADGDGDGTVDQDDYLIWKWCYGNALPGAGGIGQAVPEPATLMQFTILVMLITLIRWRIAAFDRGSRLAVAIALALAIPPTSLPSFAAGPTATVNIDLTAKRRSVPPTLHGAFFEDINYGADGGLYAELVQNRSFEHDAPLFGWTEVADDGARGSLIVQTTAPLNENNPHYLRLSADDSGSGGFGIANGGFDGIVVERGKTYHTSFYARRPADSQAELTVQLQDANGNRLAEHKFAAPTTAWEKYEAELTSAASSDSARLIVLANKPGTVDLDMISLFPVDTFRNRPNGLRRDLAQALADLKPGFFRFPGGCIVEGMNLDNAYRWKDTIGDVAERKQNYNLWRNERSPEYHQTYGLGFFEYFQFCEDIGAEPVPVVNCGMCCQARRRGEHVPISELGPWIQDALDLIEFANGPPTSEWGAKRAAMGHPEPFKLKYLAVGNEQWNEEYFARYLPFHVAIKRKHPEIEVISTSGPNLTSDLYRFAWDKFRTGTPADIVDEHYYVQPEWLLANPDWYATYDRHGPKIFVGEFAAHDGRGRRNNLHAALAEAAYMTGLVRHSDVVLMASYAPLLGKYGHAQWQPNLIWFDNSKVVLTPSYHAQAIFAQNRPSAVVPIDVKAEGILPSSAGMVGVGTWNTQAEYKDIRVTDPNGDILFESDFSDPAALNDWRTANGSWEIRDGALRQNAIATDVRATIGDPAWKDYTLTLKARKIAGDEGFLILFHTPDVDDPTWWNIGGWNNTSHAIQESIFPESHVSGSIETGRWYDIRIDVIDGTVKAYLDGELVHSAKTAKTQQLYAAAGIDDANKELVIELVNPTAKACEAAFNLAGFESAATDARLITLAASEADSENTLAEPQKVKPVESTIAGIGAKFVHTIPAHSLQVLRIPLSDQ